MVQKEMSPEKESASKKLSGRRCQSLGSWRGMVHGPEPQTRYWPGKLQGFGMAPLSWPLHLSSVVIFPLQLPGRQCLPHMVRVGPEWDSMSRTQWDIGTDKDCLVLGCHVSPDEPGSNSGENEAMKPD